MHAAQAEITDVDEEKKDKGKAIEKEEGESNTKNLLPETSKSENSLETIEENNSDNGETKSSGSQSSVNTDLESEKDANGSEVKISDDEGDKTSAMPVGMPEGIKKDIASSSIENNRNTDNKQQLSQEGKESKNPGVEESGAVEVGETMNSNESVNLEDINVQPTEENEETDEKSKSLGHGLCAVIVN